MSKLFDFSSLAMVPSAYKDGKLYSVRPVEQLGDELVTNGDFSGGSTGWTLGTGWSISGGYATHTGATGNLTSNASLTNGTKYKVTFEIVSISGGVCNIYDTSSATTYASFDSVGIKSATITKDSAGSLAIRSSSANAVIDNVSIKEAIVPNGDFTFSRGTTATRVASSGYIEKGRENVLLQSNTFDTTWALSSASITGGHSGYDGTNTAWELTKSASSGRTQQTISTSGVQTYSVYAKAGTYDWALLLITTTSGDRIGYFDLANGVVGTGFSLIDSSIESVGGGWYRCTIVFNASTTTARVYPALGDTNLGTSGSVYIQDAQLEAGLVATDYIETTTTSVSAGILEDMPRLDYSGGASCPALLLEPQRSNLIQSTEYIAHGVYGYTLPLTPTLTSGIISPSNEANAYNVTDFVAANTRLDCSTAVSAASAGTHTYSAYYKGSGSINIALNTTIGGGSGGNEKTITLTNEWVRHEITHTYDATDGGNIRVHIAISRTANNTASVDVAFPQIEAGSYPTSYIPTYGSSVTRSVDQLETSPYDYQSQGVLGANVGTIILDCETIGTSTGSNDFHMFGATQSIADGYLFRGNTGTTIDILERDSNSTSAQWTGIAVKQTRNKIGVSYSGADVDVYVNGVAKSVSSGTPVGGGNINGFSNSGSNKAGLIIHQILLFPNKLTDSEMASITTL